MLQCLKIVPYVVVTLNHRIISLTLNNCNFVTLMICNLIIFDIPMGGRDPQVENYYFCQPIFAQYFLCSVRKGCIFLNLGRIEVMSFQILLTASKVIWLQWSFSLQVGCILNEVDKLVCGQLVSKKGFLCRLP